MFHGSDHATGNNSQQGRSLAKSPRLGFSFPVENRKTLASLMKNIEENRNHLACLKMPVSISCRRSVTAACLQVAWGTMQQRILIYVRLQDTLFWLIAHIRRTRSLARMRVSCETVHVLLRESEIFRDDWDQSTHCDVTCRQGFEFETVQGYCLTLCYALGS